MDPEHACISVVGCHGRLLAIHLASTEGSDSAVAAVCEAVPADRRVDTYRVATDNPSQKLARSLLRVLPNPQYSSIDVIHLSFAVSTAFTNQRNARRKSRVVFLLQRIVSRVLAARWVGDGAWLIGKPLPQSCLGAQRRSLDMMDREEAKRLLSLLEGEVDGIESMQEYLSSIRAILMDEPLECQEKNS